MLEERTSTLRMQSVVCFMSSLAIGAAVEAVVSSTNGLCRRVPGNPFHKAASCRSVSATDLAAKLEGLASGTTFFSMCSSSSDRKVLCLCFHHPAFFAFGPTPARSWQSRTRTLTASSSASLPTDASRVFETTVARVSRAVSHSATTSWYCGSAFASARTAWSQMRSSSRKSWAVVQALTWRDRQRAQAATRVSSLSTSFLFVSRPGSCLKWSMLSEASPMSLFKVDLHLPEMNNGRENLTLISQRYFLSSQGFFSDPPVAN